MRWLQFLLLIVFVPWCSTFAEDSAVPAELQRWIPWIERAHPEWQCIPLQDNHQCVFPGIFSLKLSPEGGSFSLQVRIFQDASVPLPGSEELPPFDLLVREAEKGTLSIPTQLSFPSLHLNAGRYRIEGKFRWNHFPRELPIPEEYALVSVDAPKQLSPLRRGNILWLEEQSPTQGGDNEALSIEVVRRFEDGSPLRLTTRLSTQVSGGSRTLRLGNVLPIGATPLTVHSDLPYQLGEDGTLSLQVQPGRGSISIDAAMEQPVTKVQLPPAPHPAWPEKERWVWVQTPAFRSVEVEGGIPLSREAVEVPPEWAEGGVYEVTREGTFTIKELRRGLGTSPENTLAMQKTAWLDFDGKALTVEDVLSGSLSNSFRLNSLPPVELGSAKVPSGSALLITKDPKNGAAGVELRSQNVSLITLSRIQRDQSFSAVGWDIVPSSVNGTLHLPPGWRLFHLSGATEVFGGWIAQWTLLDIFLTVLAVALTQRFGGRVLTLVIALTVILNHGEFLSPSAAWMQVVVAGLCYSVVKERSGFWHSLLKSYFIGTLLFWAGVTLVFVKLQWTQFLFPSLEAGTRYRTFFQSVILTFFETPFLWPALFLLFSLGVGVVTLARRASGGHRILVLLFGGIGVFFALITIIPALFIMSDAPRTPTQAPSVSYEMEEKRVQEGYAPEALITKRRSASKGSSFIGQSAEDAVTSEEMHEESKTKLLQSGPARPQWNWKSVQFRVAGPVDPQKTLELYLLSPFVTMLLSLVRAVGMLFLVCWVLRSFLGAELARMAKRFSPFLLLCVLPWNSAFAEFPPEHLLQMLESQLSKERCHQQCATLSDLSWELNESRAILTFSVLSQGEGAIAIPGPLSVLPVQTVKIQGENTEILRRDSNDYLWVKVPSGQSVVEVTAALAPSQVLTVQLPQKPLHSHILSTKKWHIEGITSSGAIPSTIRILPVSQEEALPAFQQSTLPSWYRVTRALRIGEKRTVRTTIEKLGDSTLSTLVTVPLLTSERPLSGISGREGNSVVLRFPAGASTIEYDGVLEGEGPVELTAQKIPFQSEEWEVRCASSISCTISGATPVSLVENGEPVWKWMPFPEEKAEISATALSAVSGESLTIDKVDHQVRWGTALLEGEVVIALRATQERGIKLTLPSEAKIIQESLNGVSGIGRRGENGIEFSVPPAAHNIQVAYTLPWNAEVVEHVPEVQVSTSVHNVLTSLSPSADRWILWIRGPSWGPGVLIWAKLLIVVGIGIWAGSRKLLPLSVGGAAVLGIGLSSLPTLALLIPVLWLVLLELLPRFPELWRSTHKLVRLILFSGITILSLLLLYESVKEGLLSSPRMLIAGNQSSSTLLRWFVDKGEGALPQPTVYSLPLSVWRTVMLVWSIWLVITLFPLLRKTLEVLGLLNRENPNNE